MPAAVKTLPGLWTRLVVDIGGRPPPLPVCRKAAPVPTVAPLLLTDELITLFWDVLTVVSQRATIGLPFYMPEAFTRTARRTNYGRRRASRW